MAEAARGGPGATGREGVVLIKGLSRAGWEMRPMGWRLTREGFETFVPDYPSRRLTIDEAAASITGQAIEHGRLQAWSVVHVVGHSLGGVVAAKMLAEQDLPDGMRWGRAVQLGAPNEGTAVAAMLSRIGFMRRFLGPTIEEMAGERPDILAASATEGVGAIACDTGQSPMGLASGMPAPNDGKVSVASALGEAPDRLLLQTGHAFYPYSRQVVTAVTAYLRDGAFPTPAETAAA